jgi:hypothetical protein
VDWGGGVTKILEEHNASMHLEDGRSMFLRNGVTHLQCIIIHNIGLRVRTPGRLEAPSSKLGELLEYWLLSKDCDPWSYVTALVDLIIISLSVVYQFAINVLLDMKVH